ncbi:sensor histidine kinase [Dyella lipolytica]|uniref:MASE1 domain-containing protein n=1 Tax=Dyella lipolytica TaxID=1867835 RepID=A0ABW8IUR9_9GAMM|nr:MASE1 domain-containing protein [Dyella lipolytica]GLQ47619.1 sensor histidine kinase [Dyella lipolytica]
MHERSGVKTTDRWKHLAVGIGYGLGVWLFQHLTVPHFVLLCGVHVAAALLVPRRYWPAMIVSQSMAQLPVAISCVSVFGVLWSTLMVIPSLVFIAPIVYLFQTRAPLVDRKGEVNISMLVLCALAVAIVMLGVNEVQLASAVYPPGVHPMHYNHLAAQWVLGNFIGVLTVVPTVLAVWQALRRHGWRSLLTAISESRATFESVCFILPVLAILVWAGFTEPHLRALAQVAMFVPVVWLALRHGWQGAALGGTAASLALVWLMPEKYDQTTIQAEVIVAFAIATMLLLGARIEALDRRAEKERKEVRTALALAQRNVYLGEMQLRMTAQALENARETVRTGYAMMMGRLRHLQPAIDDGGYQRLALAAQDQLHGISESLHPTVWRERGLPAALREGAVARMLDHAGIRYWCELKGPLSALSSTVHLALYRMVCEALADGCGKRDVSDVCVRIRGGDVNGRRWVAVSVVFRANLVRLPHVRWDDLMPRLMRATTGAGIKALKDRAAIFEGYARERMLPDGRRISWIMLDL